MTSLAAESARPSRALHVSLWLAQLLLAAAFFAIGLMKLTLPADQLALKMPLSAGHEGLFRFIGAAEVSGALGLVLPSLTRIKPALTGYAGLGLLTIMVLAGGTHFLHGEVDKIGVNVVLGGLAAFVAWGRLKAARIAPRA